MGTVLFKGLWAHKRRLIGTLLAVFLGVAFLSGTLVLGDTLRGNFDNLFTEANAGTDVVVRHESKLSTDPGEPDSQRGLIDASLVDTVRAVDGVAGAEPSVEGFGQLVGKISVKAEPGVSQDELLNRVQRVLPRDVEAITGSALTNENTTDINKEFLDLFTTFLTVFAGVALLVATFSIYNTFSIIVAQRTRESALLRAIGAGRAQILTSVVVEAVLVGAVASAAGIVGGLGIAGLLKG